jgi:4-amino-4-deoxy-L-arabinose transferase-like glycosyltransferase
MKLPFIQTTRKILQEVTSNKLVYSLLLAILVGAFVVRVYKVDDLLGFYYDQGRDALVIWKLWNDSKPFLIGPITGLAGIFLGPAYYYLIAPFYLVSSGNPIGPAIFLSFLSVCALLVMYILGTKMHSRRAGILAAFIGGFSYYIVLAGRWLSNPTPILLTSMLLIWALWEIVHGASKKWWIAVSLLVGLSLQFESASGFFYIPIVLVIALIYKSSFPDTKALAVSIFVFLVTLLPQILFNFRHENLLLNNFLNLFISEKSFSASIGDVLLLRLQYFWEVYRTKIFPGWNAQALLFALISLSGICIHWYTQRDKKTMILFGVFLGIPAIGYTLFQGNHGNIYDYYLTGYYLPILLFFAIGLAVVSENIIGKCILAIFILLFVRYNGEIVGNYLRATDYNGIYLGNEVDAVNWIYESAIKNNTHWNLDVYVPPVIPYSYDYLFLWQGDKRCKVTLCGLTKDETVSTLYLLYEQDPPHPERLNAWLSKYENTTILKEESAFGGIVVQKRLRTEDSPK